MGSRTHNLSGPLKGTWTFTNIEMEISYNVVEAQNIRVLFAAVERIQPLYFFNKRLQVIVKLCLIERRR
jgi:hypothetical protein